MSEPIFMLNALWLKKNGGKEKYLEYAKAIKPLLEKAGAKVGDNYSAEAAIYGDFDADLIFFVEYPSQRHFEAMATSEAYQKIAHLREEAIDNSLLIRCKPFEWLAS